MAEHVWLRVGVLSEFGVVGFGSDKTAADAAWPDQVLTCHM
jgi:hypothetical protein